MKNTLFLNQVRSRVTLRSGSRTALLFESELPADDAPLTQHLREVSRAICDHAAQVYLPVAAAQLSQLSGAGRGYDFTPHRVHFRASVQKMRGRVLVLLCLCYTAGQQVCLKQNARQLWCADGSYRLK